MVKIAQILKLKSIRVPTKIYFNYIIIIGDLALPFEYKTIFIGYFSYSLTFCPGTAVIFFPGIMIIICPPLFLAPLNCLNPFPRGPKFGIATVTLPGEHITNWGGAFKMPINTNISSASVPDF